MVRFYRGSRRRRMRRLNPIQSVKKQFSQEASYAGAGANAFHAVFTGVETGTTGTVSNAPVGSKVYGVYVVVDFINGSAATTGVANWFIWKARSGQAAGTAFAATNAPNWTNIGNSDARNQVIRSETAVIPPNDGGRYRFARYIPLPPGMQRVREGDVLQIVFASDLAGTLLTAHRFKTYT